MVSFQSPIFQHLISYKKPTTEFSDNQIQQSKILCPDLNEKVVEESFTFAALAIRLDGELTFNLATASHVEHFSIGFSWLSEKTQTMRRIEV